MEKQTVVRSVFEVAKPRDVDLGTVAIKRGLPVPPVLRGKRGQYDALLQRMGAGDCVELPPKQAAGLGSRAKALGIDLARRKLPSGLVGVWRL